MNDFENFEYSFQDTNEMTITLTLEDNIEFLCGVVAIFPAEDKDYIALTPLKEETDEVFIYRFKLMDVDEPIPILEDIEDDDEFELAANAFDELTDGADYKDFIIEDGILVEYNGDGSDAVIPDGVTSIGEYAFDRCNKLTNVVIGKGITNIDKWAFANCENLTIKSYAGSYVETYAKENNIPFVAIEQ